MFTIRDLFHKIGNQHNKISISSGVLREYIKRKPSFKLSGNGSRGKNKKLVKSLDEIEKTALKADKLLNELRRVVYNLVDPDRELFKNSQ